MRFIFLMVLLCGCASRPETNLTPIESPNPQASRVSVLSVSTRERSEDPGEVYNGERSSGDPEFAIVDVSIPPTHEKGRLEWPEQVPPDPAREFATLDLQFPDREEVHDWFTERHSDGRLLVFVHGYNVRFSDAVYRLAQVSNDLGQGAAPILFSWPSRGTLSSYLYDKDSATYSRDALEVLLEAAAESPEVTEITVLAHSMGAWLTMESLRQIAIRNGSIDPKIQDVILASPDIDEHVFSKQFDALGDDRPEFTIVVSSDDRALQLSRLLSGHMGRLGNANVNTHVATEWLRTHPGVTILDLSELDVGGSLHHSKFAESAGALDVIDQTLQGASGDEAVNIIQRASVHSVLVTLSASMEETVMSFSAGE